MTKKNRPIALVTGGSAGIGAAICQHLLAADYEVLSLARRGSPSSHERLHDFEVDLADIDATTSLASEIADKFPATTLVHNAGVIRPALLEDVEQSDLDYLARLHISSIVALTQAFVPAMRTAGFGRIVFVSTRAIVGLETRTSYSATKAAQIGLMRTWSMELAKDGITVNAVAPGPIETDMLHEIIPENSPKKQKLASSMPVKRLGRPEDVARAVMFFAAPESSFITGQLLFVCGGTSLGSLSL